MATGTFDTVGVMSRATRADDDTSDQKQLRGLAIVFKLWHVAHAPRWMMFSGAGYVSLMLPPAVTGFAVAWGMVRLATRGWGRASLGLAGAGAVGLVAGLLVL